ASLGMLHEAQQQGREGHLSVQLVQADLQTLPLADAVADGAMANHVLYHVPNQVHALSEMRRVVKPGGSIVLTTNAATSQKRLKEIHQWAAREAGYTPIDTGSGRFSLDDLPLVRSVFPDAECDFMPNAFVFPTADAALRYYASGYVDQIAEWQPGRSHLAQLLPLVRGRLEEIIAREGVFRDDKTVGCFVAPN
ncbi:MAG TPA: class I SAM-dependent methyltransferase, partial [Chloroflexota bacterium]|nr:class I SAM-dependent methyltransferase [Chloroflexota bacterium]